LGPVGSGMGYRSRVLVACAPFRYFNQRVPAKARD